MRRWQIVLAGAGTLTAAAACGDATSSSRQSRVSATALAAALASTPVGYGDLTSSYVGSPAATAGDSTVYIGRGGGHGDDHGMGEGGLMGGGIGDAFVGGLGPFGGGHGEHGPFGGGGLGCTGTFAAASGRVACDPVTLRNGLTVARTASYADASGQVQQAFDSLTTDVVNVQTSVTGTVSFTAPDSTGAAEGPDRDGGHHGHGGGHGGAPIGRLLGDTAHVLSATTTVQSASDRTVSGLAAGSSSRTVNATSSGTETTTGTTTLGAFTATRTAGDTTSGLVIPVRTGAPTYPTAGTVTRVMSATLTYADQSPVTVTRREVVTYDGTATAHVVITENGTTRNCTRALPRGELACS